MTNAIIITISVLLLIAYGFDLTASKTRIPSVILLLLLGWAVQQITRYFQIAIPDLSTALPILGTVGLILIVLEGALELEFNRSKGRLIGRSLVTAALPMILLAVGLAWVMQLQTNSGWRACLVNAIPLAVISSAIAIPSARNLAPAHREFITYETSLSDILGVLLFNFFALNDEFSANTVGKFGLELILFILLSFIATIALAYLMTRVRHPIKFVPIVLLVILIYAVSKVYHLPGLVFILIFGLLLGNLDELKGVKWIRALEPDKLDQEVKKLHELLVEGTFMVRSLFFLLFGFLIETNELVNPDSLFRAIGITAAIFALRWAQLKLLRLPVRPLLFMAPRGLITILLFLSISPDLRLQWVSKSLVIQVIMLTALVMMTGMILMKQNPNQQDTNPVSDEKPEFPLEP